MRSSIEAKVRKLRPRAIGGTAHPQRTGLRRSTNWPAVKNPTRPYDNSDPARSAGADGCLGKLNQQLALVLTDVLSEEVEPLVDMRDDRLIGGRLQVRGLRGTVPRAGEPGNPAPLGSCR